MTKPAHQMTDDQLLTELGVAIEVRTTPPNSDPVKLLVPWTVRQTAIDFQQHAEYTCGWQTELHTLDGNGHPIYPPSH